MSEQSRGKRKLENPVEEEVKSHEETTSEEEEEEHISGSGDDDDDDDDDEEQLDVQLDSIACIEEDYHRIVPLIQKACIGLAIHAGSIADAIIAQSHVGGVIKIAIPAEVPGDHQGNGKAKATTKDDTGKQNDEVEVDETVFAVTTMLNVAQRDKIQGLDQLMKAMEQKVDGKDQKLFGDIMKKRVGLLIAERFLNIPVPVGIASLSALKEDLKSAIEQGEAFKFDYVIAIAVGVVMHASAPSTSKKQKRKLESVPIFYRPEDEVFEKHAELTIRTDQPNPGAGEGARMFRNFMILRMSALWAALEELKANPVAAGMEMTSLTMA